MFTYASDFNQDVSKWNTGAVTNMASSKCTRSLSLSVVMVAFRCGVLLLNIYTATRVSSDHNPHTFCFFVFVFSETVPFVLFVMG